MVARVATFALNARIIASAMRTQSEIAKLQIQDSSGKISSDYGGLGSSSKNVLDLQVSIARSKSYQAAATSAGDRVQAMYSAVGSVADLLANFKAQLTGALSTSGSDATSLSETAAGYMKELASQLNTQFGGRFLFAGSNTETAPVNLSSYSNTTSTSLADTSYYTGNGDVMSVQIAADQSVAYGVTAGDPAFEQAMRAFSMIANAPSSPPDSNTLSAAIDLATSALDGVTGAQTRLSLTASRLDRSVSQQQDFQDYASSLESGLTDVDVASVTAALSSYQAQLEASYSALSKVLSLRLSDYLK
jgi:flagellar hook-associated protein 3 FlgL